ncbi:MAG: hypothetical protein IJ088_08390 [Clostridia bacterium]|nr:hypothetical protein [Clostridia bacterium]
MKLYLTGKPCSQERHCYYVQGSHISFIVDCGFQRRYPGDELPHLTEEQIRSASYLFLTHSHENQSGALPFLLSNGFNGRIVLTTETARQLTIPFDDILILEALSLPYDPFQLPGGLKVVWGRSGHCSGSAWFRFEENGRSIFFSGDYYAGARVHAIDPIVGIRADLAVLDCDYGLESGNTRASQVSKLASVISDALTDGRPILLPVPKFGRGIGIMTCLCEKFPFTDIFADTHFITELGHLDASALWVRPDFQEMLNTLYIRTIPEDFIALGIYFISDPQMDNPETRQLAARIMECGGIVIFTGTVEPNSRASLMLHSGQAQLIRYGVHCTQEDMLQIAAQNTFHRIIAYNSDYSPKHPVYEV